MPIEEQIRETIRQVLREELVPAVREVVREVMSAPPLNPDQLVDASRAAEILRRTPEAVRMLVRRGSLPAQKIGHRVSIRVRDLLALPAGREG